jgi:triacylglycerol esterase/lipase EstA (alpha/beta hydrolase family)
MSHFLLRVAMVLGFFALLKIINNVSSGLFFAKPIHWIHAMVFEVLAFGAVAVLRLLHFSMPKKVPIFSKNGKPILLVHGYCNSSCVWTYIHQYLMSHTSHPVYTIDLGYPFHSLRTYAQAVTKKVKEICQETGQENVILIGHSMGGVVSSLVAMEHDSLIAAVFTIGSPIGGTYVAKIGVGANAREMERHSQLILELSKQLEAKSHVPFYHIATKTDQMVVPSSSGFRGITPEREFIFEDIGHASLLFSPRVAGLLVHWLKDV